MRDQRARGPLRVRQLGRVPIVTRSRCSTRYSTAQPGLSPTHGAPARLHVGGAGKARARDRRSGIGRRRDLSSRPWGRRHLPRTGPDRRGYPIISVDLGPGAIPAYVHGVEQLVVDTLFDLGLKGAGRLDGLPGVWVEPKGRTRARYSCAIGVRVEPGAHDARFRVECCAGPCDVRPHRPVRDPRPDGDVARRRGDRSLASRGHRRDRRAVAERGDLHLWT